MCLNCEWLVGVLGLFCTVKNMFRKTIKRGEISLIGQPTKNRGSCTDVQPGPVCTSMQWWQEKGQEPISLSLTLLLKVSVLLLTKGVFTLLPTSRHKKMLTVFLTQLETGVTPI